MPLRQFAARISGFRPLYPFSFWEIQAIVFAAPNVSLDAFNLIFYAACPAKAGQTLRILCAH